MPHSLSGEGLACNLASSRETTIGIPGAMLAGNNCHQFADRRGHAFHVVPHAREASALLRVLKEEKRQKKKKKKKLEALGNARTQFNHRNNDAEREQSVRAASNEIHFILRTKCRCVIAREKKFC